MDDSAPITWLIGQIDSIVSGGASSTASAIATAVTPLASVCFGIYIILICINYMRGAETEPVIDFGMRIAGFAVIISLGLNAATYTSTVIPIVTGLGSDLASAVSKGSATAGTLDQLALHYLKILDEGYESANAPVFPFNVGPLVLYTFKAILILVGLIPFLVAATVTLIIANVGTVLVACVGPLFFAFLIFPATRQYFSAWVNTAISFSLIPIFVAVIAVISIQLSTKMFSSDGGATLDDVSLKAVFLASLGNLVLIYLLKMVGSLASSLSAGGINVGMPGGIGSFARAMRQSGVGSAREIGAAYRGYQAGKSMTNRLSSRFGNRNNSIERKPG